MAQPPSKRLRITHKAFDTASERVRAPVTPEALAALLPSDMLEKRETAEYIASVAVTANRMLQSEFERAWVKLSSAGAFADFAARANELDALEAVAEARLHAKHLATHTYARSADPELAVAALTTPLLQSEIDTMRSSREQLDLATLDSAQRTLERYRQATDLETDLRQRLALVQSTNDNFSTASWANTQATQDRLSTALGELGAT